jgi:hypothetical protein
MVAQLLHYILAEQIHFKTSQTPLFDQRYAGFLSAEVH